MINSDDVWKSILQIKFPVFGETFQSLSPGVTYLGRDVFKQVFTGTRSCVVHVVNRDLDPAWSMSCYPANACYKSHSNTYEAQYFGFEHAIERGIIPDRIRAIPRDIQSIPLGGILPKEPTVHFRVGDFIELQWRRQNYHPYVGVT